MSVRVSDESSSSDLDWLADTKINAYNDRTRNVIYNDKCVRISSNLENDNIYKNISVAETDSRFTKNEINNSQSKSIVCWNVNGLSARFRQSDLFRMFEHMVKETDVDADIIQLSETHVKRDPNDPSKAHTEDVGGWEEVVQGHVLLVPNIRPESFLLF